MADFTNLNTFIPQVINQYQEPFYNKMLRASPIMNLVPRRTYDNADGLSPLVITTTSSLPTDYPTMGSLARSNGTGSVACDVTATKIEQGYTSQTYSLETKAFESEILCATDLDFGPNGLAGTAQTIANYYKNMELNVRTFWEDWYRIKNLSIIQNKISTLVNDLADTVTDTNANFSGVDAPTDVLQWSHLDPLWDLALNTGMSELSPVTSAGMPAFFLVVSPRTKRRLFQYDQLVRDTVNWQTGDAALENFKAMGIDTAINGFVPIVDPRPIRYAADKTTKIYPLSIRLLRPESSGLLTRTTSPFRRVAWRCTKLRRSCATTFGKPVPVLPASVTSVVRPSTRSTTLVSSVGSTTRTTPPIRSVIRVTSALTCRLLVSRFSRNTASRFSLK